MTLAEKLARMEEQLETLPQGLRRMEWVMEQARQRPGLPEHLRVDSNLVPGCLARLWMVSRLDARLCHFESDSNSLVVKGVAGLLCDFYSGLSPDEVLALEPDFLLRMGITQHLTPNRRHSLHRVRQLIREFAAQAAARDPDGNPAPGIPNKPG